MTDSKNPNAKWKMLEYRCEGENGNHWTVEVYVLPAHTAFQGFGGSSGGLVTGKTPSLITRTRGPWGSRDYETDVHNAEAWDAIKKGLMYQQQQACMKAVQAYRDMGGPELETFYAQHPTYKATDTEG